VKDVQKYTAFALAQQRGAAQRQASAAPLATSGDRDKRCYATTPKNRAQVRGRASGVRCTQCWAA